MEEILRTGISIEFGHSNSMLSQKLPKGRVSGRENTTTVGVNQKAKLGRLVCELLVVKIATTRLSVVRLPRMKEFVKECVQNVPVGIALEMTRINCNLILQTESISARPKMPKAPAPQIFDEKTGSSNLEFKLRHHSPRPKMKVFRRLAKLPVGRLALMITQCPVDGLERAHLFLFDICPDSGRHNPSLTYLELVHEFFDLAVKTH